MRSQSSNKHHRGGPLRFHGMAWLAILVLPVMLTTVCVPAMAQTFSITPLEPVVIQGQAFQTYAKAVSMPLANERVVAGYAQETIEGQEVMLPICWSVDHLGLSAFYVLDFPSEVFAGAVAAGVNSYGEIVGGGTFDDGTGQGVGLYWADDFAAPVIIVGISGETHCHLSQINDDGIMVGFSVNASGKQALAWRVREDGTITGPLVLPTRRRGATDDAALSVGPTNSGITEIAGSSDGAAVLWKVRTTSSGDLMLDGSIEVLDSVGEATGCSFSGAVCGNDRSRAVIWEPRVKNKRSKTTLNYDQNTFSNPGRPYQMTDAGMVVGSASLKGNVFPPRAVVWASRTAPMRTLESMGDVSPFLSLNVANAVNDMNEIVGYGWMGSAAGGYQAFIAMPVK